jgi:hypothetical protein
MAVGHSVYVITIYDVNGVLQTYNVEASSAQNAVTAAQQAANTSNSPHSFLTILPYSGKIDLLPSPP